MLLEKEKNLYKILAEIFGEGIRGYMIQANGKLLEIFVLSTSSNLFINHCVGIFVYVMVSIALFYDLII